MTSIINVGFLLRNTTRRLPWVMAVIICLLAPLSGTLTAAAQGAPTSLDRWNVEVWPEYDRPAVLVLLNGALQADAGLPVTARVPVPLGVQINAVAYPGDDGRLISIPWESQLTATGQDIVFTLEQPQFVVEYYADVISPPPSRSFEIDLAAPYPVQQASATLRLPARASDLQTTPAMEPTGTDSLGNPLLALQLGPLAAGQRVPLSVSYTKADANPTIANAVVGDDAVAAAPTATSGTDWTPLVAGVLLGLLVVAGIAYVLLRRNRAAGGSRQARRRAEREKGAPTARAESSVAPQKSAENLFCAQCGTKYLADDKFCRSCGAVRR